MTFFLPRLGIALMLAVAACCVQAQTKPALVRNIDEGALQPFQAYLFPHSSSNSTATDSFSVPAGKRLVIEYYSSQAQDLSGGNAGLTLLTTAGGTTLSYIVYVSKNDTYAVNQMTRIYADPGTVVQAFAFNTGATCAGLIYLSGHLVDVSP